MQDLENHVLRAQCNSCLQYLPGDSLAIFAVALLAYKGLAVKGASMQTARRLHPRAIPGTTAGRGMASSQLTLKFSRPRAAQAAQRQRGRCALQIRLFELVPPPLSHCGRHTGLRDYRLRRWLSVAGRPAIHKSAICSLHSPRGLIPPITFFAQSQPALLWPPDFTFQDRQNLFYHQTLALRCC
jgi:hypothetical protein